jgi:hypothetical protein
MCNNKNSRDNSAEVADIFNLYGDAYCEQYKLPAEQYKAINAIRNCRTAALGGHVQKCDSCGAEVITYNSCRNRHCPKCQSMAKVRWLEQRQAELLPVEYFHVVFTIPHELNSLASYNQAKIYNILFKSAWTTIQTLGNDKKRLGGEMAMLAALHTWGQTLFQHIHLHCIVPGGALKNDEQWISSKPGFLFPVKVMSRIFRGTFVHLIREALQDKKLQLPATSAQKTFDQLLNGLMQKEWVVYAKEPFNGAQGGIDYLSRYVYKIAISNNRIVSSNDGKVTFTWRDYSDDNKNKTMILDAHEFIRRFLTHVLPNAFMRIRSFGFLANSCKAKKIARILKILTNTEINKSENNKETAAELMLRITGVDITLCPICKTGRLQIIQNIISFKQKQNNHQYWNTS